MDLSPSQISVLQRLHARGLEIVAFPMYENLVGIRKGNCAALLIPTGSEGFQVQGSPTYLVAGNLSARVARSDGHYFVRKQDAVKATPDILADLDSFAAELADGLLPVA